MNKNNKSSASCKEIKSTPQGKKSITKTGKSENTSFNDPKPTVGNVNVVCRFRPLNDKEKNITKDSCVEFVDETNIILKTTTADPPQIYKFNFDRIFDTNSLQQEVYDFSAKPIIESVLEGFNGTIFAYGQTGSGKTHTMQGILDNPEREGIIPRMIRNVFNHIFQSSSDIEFTVKVSMIEIYMEKIKDLIIPQRINLSIREDKNKGIYIEDLSEHYASNEEEVLELMRIGSENRAISATNMNEHSSRSHSIFIMTIHQTNIKDLVAKTGKLYLVDLAGSEKTSKTGAQGITLDEAKTINKSLTTLGMVINNLTDGRSTHIPYRDSKLTRVLQESLGGNAKTSLIITCSSSTYNDQETLSTLRFGLRAKKIKNKPKINKEVTIAELKSEIEKLENLLHVCNKRISQLENFIAKNNLSVPTEDDYSFMNKKTEILEETTNNEEIIEYIDNDDISNQHITSDDIFTESQELNTEINNENITENSKKLENLISNNKDLNEKLDDAFNRIHQLSSTMMEKEAVIKELNKIKEEYDLKEYELQEKICELQEKLDIQNNAIRRADNNSDEVYEKIQDIFNSIRPNGEESDENVEQNLLINFTKLFGFIKNKINESTDNIYLKNLNFDIFENKESNNFNEEVSKKERIKYESEKKLILKTLDEKTEKITLYEHENRELKERIKLLESKMNPDDKNYVKKILTLEKNLEQVNLMYHQVVTQKSVLKIENQVLEKKIKKRSEKIITLEKENLDLKDQIKMRDEKLTYYQKNNLKNAAIVKVIKGGSSKFFFNNIVETENGKSDN